MFLYLPLLFSLVYLESWSWLNNSLENPPSIGNGWKDKDTFSWGGMAGKGWEFGHLKFSFGSDLSNQAAQPILGNPGQSGPQNTWDWSCKDPPSTLISVQLRLAAIWKNWWERTLCTVTARAQQRSPWPHLFSMEEFTVFFTCRCGIKQRSQPFVLSVFNSSGSYLSFK